MTSVHDWADDKLTPASTATAILSPCRTWRYVLTRRWAPGPEVLWVLLNPSTADETEDDPTVRKAKGFSQRWGFGGLVFCNLFAFRATNPADMKKAPDPIGPRNDDAILAEAEAVHTVVLAWGRHGDFMGRGEAVARMLKHRDPWCLGRNADGSPRHPLYLPYSTPAERFA